MFLMLVTTYITGFIKELLTVCLSVRSLKNLDSAITMGSINTAKTVRSPQLPNANYPKVRAPGGLTSGKRPPPVSDYISLTLWVVAYGRFDCSSDTLSRTSSFSAPPPKKKLFPSTHEIDASYLSHTSFRGTITSLHFLKMFLFFVVDPRFRPFFVSSVELLLELSDGVEEKHGMDETGAEEDDARLLSISASRSKTFSFNASISSSMDLMRIFLSSISELSCVLCLNRPNSAIVFANFHATIDRERIFFL